MWSTARKRSPAKITVSPRRPGTETTAACGLCSSSGGHGSFSSACCRSLTKRTPSRGSWKLSSKHESTDVERMPKYLTLASECHRSRSPTGRHRLMLQQISQGQMVAGKRRQPMHLIFVRRLNTVPGDQGVPSSPQHDPQRTHANSLYNGGLFSQPGT